MIINNNNNVNSSVTKVFDFTQKRMPASQTIKMPPQIPKNTDPITAEILLKKYMVATQATPSKQGIFSQANIKNAKDFVSLECDYPEMISAVRSAFCNKQYSAIGNFEFYLVYKLNQMNILQYKRSLNNQTTITVNSEASSFVTGGMAHAIYLADYISQNIHPDAIYIDVMLQDINTSAKYRVPVMYLKNDRLYFMIVSSTRDILSGNTPSAIKKLTKITEIVSRLKSNIAIVVGTDINGMQLYNYLKANVQNVENIVVTKFNTPDFIVKKLHQPFML